MKKALIKVLVLSITLALLVLTVFPCTIVNAQDNFDLFAVRLGYDNNKAEGIITKMSYIAGDLTEDGKITSSDANILKSLITGNSNTLSSSTKSAADIDCDGKITSKDANLIKVIVLGRSSNPVIGAANSAYSLSSKSKSLKLSGSATDYSVRIDFSDKDTANKCVTSIVLNTTSDNFDIYPVIGTLEGASKDSIAEKKSHSGHTYYSFAELNGADVNGIILSAHGSSVYVSEIFACANDESAEWIIDNHINPSYGTPKDLTVTESEEKVALRLGQMTSDDKTNTNGGMYHDFINSKWPSVAVDENDKLYITASGCRMMHVDPFGATVMVTSSDGGKTFSKPQQVSNTILDDRDAGVTYLGDGKLLVSYFTSNLDNFLPDGGNYNVMMLDSFGGSSPSWQASSWDKYGNPVGGINGTYIACAQFIKKNDPTYNTSAASYVVKSTDYGQTWNTEKYSFNSSKPTTAMKNMLTNYQINRPGTEVPVTSEHGPIKMSDGTVLYAGKVLNTVDQAIDTMAVYVSHDDGDTWEYRSEIERPYSYGVNNFHELSVTETKDGALLCAIRTQYSDTGRTDIFPVMTVYTCHSYDGGRTWTVPTPTGIDGSPPHVITMPNGDIVMVTGHRTDPRSIYVNVSTDGGRTWSDFDTLTRSFKNGDDMGYPASAALSNGKIVTVYYGSYHNGTWWDSHTSVMTTGWTYTLK